MIRPARVSDYERMCDLWRNCVDSTHHFLKEKDREFYAGRLPEYFDLCLMYVYEDGEALVQGFAGVLDDKLEMLFVDASAMGMGIGRALLTFVVEDLNVRKVDVNEQNVRAIGFYESFGFERCGRSPRDGEGREYPLVHMIRS